LGGFAALAVMLTLSQWLTVGSARRLELANITALAGVAGVLASAMVYVDTRRPFWSPRFAFGNFLGTMLLLGVMLASVGLCQAHAAASLIQMFGLVGVAIRTILFLWRHFELRAALRNPESPIHFNARVIRELLPWLTPAQTCLFGAAIGFGALVIYDWMGASLVWAGLAAFITFASEIMARHAFFAAGGSKRMPGGIAG
jgi:DMSO reductase anchor subunit